MPQISVCNAQNTVRMKLYHNMALFTIYVFVQVQFLYVRSKIRLHTMVYADATILIPARSATAIGIPNKDDAIESAPNVLNTVCHLYPAEYPTPIPPIIPIILYIEGGSTLYNTINKRHPTILNMPRSAARCGQSSVKGKQTDIQAIPAHIALGNPSRDTISIALETINVSFIYHTFLAERISNSRNRSKKVLRYGLFF